MKERTKHLISIIVLSILILISIGYLINDTYKIEVERTIHDYYALIKPNVELGRHVFWSNFPISKKEFSNIDVSRSTQEELSKDLGMPIPRLKPRLLLRNCVNPKMGEHIFNCAFKNKQENLVVR